MYPFIPPTDPLASAAYKAVQASIYGTFDQAQEANAALAEGQAARARKTAYEKLFIHQGPDAAPIFGDRITEDDMVSGVAGGRAGKSRQVSDLYIP